MTRSAPTVLVSKRSTAGSKTAESTWKRPMYSRGGRCALPRAICRSRHALSNRPSNAGKAPPPCAKQIRSVSGSRSKAPPKIMRVMERCVSAGMPTVQPIMKSLERSPGPMVDISQGCTKTGKSSAAQCAKKATMRSSSKSTEPQWLPIWTPTCPSFFARETSWQAASTSFKATWQRVSSRPCAAGSRTISRAMSLKSRAMAAVISGSRCH
mmetsp:Transcript_7765/g.20020  ORF Transcript_7765/g.20020 Transcript_7765/m.20020 type:complete len:211 (+) Transcript_7765:2553-3185(+)